MLLAFYEIIALIMLYIELISPNTQNTTKLLNKISQELIYNRFTQISNSEHGMALWKNWEKAFELNELYDELDQEYTRWMSQKNNRKKDLLLLLSIFIQLCIYLILLGYIK